jgi:hypothetical protein
MHRCVCVLGVESPAPCPHPALNPQKNPPLSEYGKEFDYEAPVRLLDKMLHAQAERPDQQCVVLSQVLAADVNLGYEDILNCVVRLYGGMEGGRGLTGSRAAA